MYIECGENCIETCQNNVFRKANFDTKLYTKLTDGKGLGLFTNTTILPDQFIIEYVGEVLDVNQFNERMTTANKNNEINYYYVEIGANHYIDAKNYGNLSRFINHSCSPNARLEKWTTYGHDFREQTKLGFFAIKRIEVNEEITFDYDWQTNTKCFCGSKSCRGTI